MIIVILLWRAFVTIDILEPRVASLVRIVTLLKKQAEERKFIGLLLVLQHKSSRHDLLFQLSDINPFYCHKTPKFNQKIIDADEMSKILSSTIFAPCPNGFVHPETYRVYEADVHVSSITKRDYNFCFHHFTIRGIAIKVESEKME